MTLPVTDWQRLQHAATGDKIALGELYSRYREPVLAYLRGAGMKSESAEDLLQNFFLYAMEDNFFARADRNRGRFRDLLLTALRRFRSKARRAELAARRQPAGGFAGGDVTELPDHALVSSDPAPDKLFTQAWAKVIVHRVIAAFDLEFAERHEHRTIFHRCIVDPILHGSPVPAHRDLALELGVTEKVVANRLQTARNAYARLLAAEIAQYASGDADAAQEQRELFRDLSSA
jgi:DNA-directed RNA polymerase specialized sigma24 family protein